MTPETSPPDLITRLRVGSLEGWRTLLKLLKFVVPLYILVSILQQTGVLAGIGKACAPFMALFGLPGETALAFLAAFTLNLYSAVAILAPLQLTPFEITQCGLMMGIAHNLFLEGGVLSGTGTRGFLLTLSRLLIAALAGWLLLLIRPVTGL